MKALVTGASGQVGTALLASVPAGVSAVALSHEELDITDERAVVERVSAEQPDVIINAAAYTAVDKAENDVVHARAVNEFGPRYLARAALAMKRCRLVHLSTDFVFDGSSGRPYTPDASPNPLSVYGHTKLEGERAVRAVLPYMSAILRTAWVYAATGRNFLRAMLRLMSERREVRVVDDQTGTPTAAHSVATALWALVQRPGCTGIFHWTDAGVASWYDFAVAIAEEGAAAGLLPSGVIVTPISTEEYPTPARRPAFSVLDKRSTATALELSPVHWRTNLRRICRGLSHA